MICERCKEAGKKSRVYEPAGWFATLMCDQRYYDEDGKYHHHDPNGRSGTYRCSEGHVWHTARYSKCPSCDYNQGRDKIEYERAGDEHDGR